MKNRGTNCYSTVKQAHASLKKANVGFASSYDGSTPLCR